MLAVFFFGGKFLQLGKTFFFSFFAGNEKNDCDF
jgi:hypothetical protein